MMGEMLPLPEAAEALDCTQETLVELLKDGTLPGLKFGRSWVLHRGVFYEEVGRLALARMRDRAAGRIAQVVPFPAPQETKKPGRARLR